jgi:hypothetical protein
MHTHEKIVCVWIWPAYLEQLHEVMELTMYVTADRHWAFLKLLLACNMNMPGIADRSSLTTGCTLDSSCNISLACRVLMLACLLHHAVMA